MTKTMFMQMPENGLPAVFKTRKTRPILVTRQKPHYSWKTANMLSPKNSKKKRKYIISVVRVVYVQALMNERPFLKLRFLE